MMTDTPAIIVLMPTRGAISLETHQALAMNMDGIRELRVTVARKPVDEARNELAWTALKIAADDPCHIGRDNYLVLWVDDDAFWLPGTVGSFIRTMQERTDINILCSYYCKREPYCAPAAFPKALERKLLDGKPGLNFARFTRDEWKPGQIDEIIGGSGMHFTMHRLRVLEAVGSDPFTPDENSLAEDIAFYQRCHKAGLRAVMDSRVPVAHVDVDSGLAFVPLSPPKRVYGNQLIDAEPGAYDGKVRLRSYGAKVDALLAEARVRS